MKLSKRAMLLRLLRTELILVPPIFLILYLCRLLGAEHTVPLVIYCISAVVISLLILLRYKSFKALLGTEALHFSLGLLLYKEVSIEYKSICALRVITGPISRLFSLCNAVLYIGGSRIITPLVPIAFADELAKKLAELRRIQSENDR